MKTSRYIILPLLMLWALFSASCTYHSINGDLDGQWQLMNIELPDGTQNNPKNAYLCIYMHTVNLTSPNHPTATANMVYDKISRTLNLEFPYKKDLSFWGLPEAPCTVTFDIIGLNKQNLVMTLQPDGAIFTFRKF